MIKYILITLAFGAFVFGTLEVDAAVMIRVRVHQSPSPVHIAGEGLKLTSGHPSDAHLLTLEPASKMDFRVTGQRWQVKVDGSPWTTVQAGRLTLLGTGSVRVGLRHLPARVDVVRTKRGVDLVANLPLESYLAGVLPAEMPTSWPIDALKAQAVAARSYALRLRQERRQRHFDVDASIIDQAYTFIPGHAHTSEGKRVLQALKDTKGEVLRDVQASQRIVKAYYSADCGCQSEDPKYVWGQSESMESVGDPTCRDRPTFLWTVNVRREDFKNMLLEVMGVPTATKLRTVHVASRTPSGRVHRVAISLRVDGAVQNKEISAQEFRRMLGFGRVRSTHFSIKWEGEKLHIAGQGRGHGVGLCQQGARSLSEQGMGYRDILKIFYPRATVKSA